MGGYWSVSRYHLHVQLSGIELLIWRKIVVPGSSAFIHFIRCCRS
jgi:hypothetical protein